MTNTACILSSLNILLFINKTSSRALSGDVYIWLPSHFCMASEGEPHGQAVERIAFISGYHLTSAWRLRASPMVRQSSVLRLYLVTISLLYGV